jgi:threonine/homoserine/homoserine lactone efflux protein
MRALRAGNAPARVRASLTGPMGDVVGQILSFAVGVAVSPVPIIAVVLMLTTDRGRVNGPAFVLGWIAGLALAGTAILLLAGQADASDGGEPATWVGVLKLMLGLGLLALAVKQWRGRPADPEAAELPNWMQKIDGFAPGRALALAVALAAVNPKNLLLTVGAATTIAHAGLEAGEQAVALSVFILVASLGIGAPVAIYFALGEKSASLLGGLKDWMAHNNAAIMTVLLLVLGAKLLGDGITAL